MHEFLAGLSKILSELSNYTIPFMALCGFLSYIIKPIRCRIGEAIKKISNSKEINSKIDMLLENDQKSAERLKLYDKIHLSALKNRITNLYFKYIDSEQLPSFEKQNLVEHYELYKKLGGNGYVDTLYVILIKKREKSPDN